MAMISLSVDCETVFLVWFFKEVSHQRTGTCYSSSCSIRTVGTVEYLVVLHIAGKVVSLNVSAGDTQLLWVCIWCYGYLN